jgi:dTDP-4-dehydrorhamnose reductase
LVILITGGTGILGKELQTIFPNALIPSHSVLDISNRKNVFDFLECNDIDTIIHTAAKTSVRQCEEEKSLAWLTNVDGTKNLVDASLNSNSKIKFLYVSTACVFDGHTGMYDENSIPYPENFYALTKLIGEQHVSKLDESLILRTNFVGRMKWPYPKAFTDRFGTYLFADDVAKGIADVVQKNLTGIIHIVGDKKISMFELAKINTPDILPMTMNDYSGPNLTIDMSLDTKVWKKYHLHQS